MPWHLVKGLEQFARILQSCLEALADFQAPCVLLTAGGRVGVTGTQHDHLQTSHPAPWLAGSAALLLQSLSAPGSFINLKKKQSQPRLPWWSGKTLCFLYRRHGIDPWSGKSHMQLNVTKKESQPIHLRVAVLL